MSIFGEVWGTKEFVNGANLREFSTLPKIIDFPLLGEKMLMSGCSDQVVFFIITLIYSHLCIISTLQ